MILFAFQTCSKTIQLKSLNFYGLWLWSFWGLCRCSAWRSSGFGLQPVCCELYGCSVEPKQEHLTWIGASQGFPKVTSPKLEVAFRPTCCNIVYMALLRTTHWTLPIRNISKNCPHFSNVNSTSIFEITANIYRYIINKQLTKPILMASWHILTVGCCVTSKVWLLASAMAFPTLRRPLFAGLVRPTQGRWETRSWICWT